MATVLLLTMSSPAAADWFIGIDVVTKTTFVLDPTTGESYSGSPITIVGDYIWGSCRSDVAGELFATDLDVLYRIDVVTGATETVGPYLDSPVRELAYDADSDTLYGVYLATLFAIDPQTAAHTPIGSTGFQFFSLTFIPGVGLFAVDTVEGGLHQLNTSTGAPTLVGVSGVVPVYDISYDASLGVLVAVTQFELFHIDPLDGSPTLILSGIPESFSLSNVDVALSLNPFIRGDANGDGSLSLADAFAVIDVAFSASPVMPPCPDAADYDDNGVLNVSDVLGLLNGLFAPGAVPPSAPGFSCGDDTTIDLLTHCPAGNC